MNFVNQRPKEELLFRCSCGGNHFLSFSRGTFPEDNEWGYIEIISEYRPADTLWGRLKMAWKLLWNKCPFESSVQLTEEDVMELAMWSHETIEWIADSRFSETFPAENILEFERHPE